MFDRLRILFAKGTQVVCGGVEEIGVGFQQWSVAGSQCKLPGRTIERPALSSFFPESTYLSILTDATASLLDGLLHFNYTLPGNSIEVTDVVKDLGVLMDNSLSPNIHGKEAASKAIQVLFMIRRSCTVPFTIRVRVC